MNKQIKTVTNTKEVNPILDYATWACLILMVIGFVMFSQYNKMTGMAMKLGYSLIAFAACSGVYSLTAMGRETLSFAKLSRIEFLKIVWPSQQEASRMTMMVIFAVAILAVLLWVLDAALFWLVRLVTG
ncbi:MAG: preprotein translocase subunit SecE [Gammaproteobacteria bacterium]|nr:preprotein translocase subunit SecE [Gammaproteobacteria bacterium]